MQSASGENTRKEAIPREPLWFAAALFPMVTSQILRLQQTDPATWLFCDYIGRIAALLILTAIPAAGAAAFKHEELRVKGEEVIAWILAIILGFFVFNRIIGHLIAGLPDYRLGAYPQLHGWLYGIDLSFGLALVAVHEEIVFRRCARHIFRARSDRRGDRCGDGLGMIVATSLLFGAYHWWTGFPNIVSATLFGAVAMLLYRRTGTIWPAVIAHYILDFIAFV